MNEAMLALDGIDVYYGNIRALQSVSLEVRRGEVVTLIGSNGAGKTTTLRAIAGLNGPRTGRITFEGERIDGLRAHDIVARRISQAPEGRHVFPRMTVRENLEMGAFSRRGANLHDDYERVYGLFPILLDRTKQKAGTLSGGEQQMLAMARAVTTEPALLFLDEISMGLAPLIVAELFDLVAQLASEGISILLVEQFANTALAVADYAALMSKGRIELVGEPADVAGAVSAAYLGGVE